MKLRLARIPIEGLRPQLKMKKLLFLDDSTMSQQLVVRFLEGVCSVRVIDNLAAGWQAICSEPFDMVIADYLFPEGDLLDFLKQVREVRSPMELPILVASGSLDRQMVSQATRLGANDCLAKPFRRAELRALVETMLAKPYVKHSETDVAVVLAFEWNLGGRYYQYMPELGQTVEAGTEKEAERLMHQALEEAFLKGDSLGYIVHSRVVTHVVEKQNTSLTHEAQVEGSGGEAHD